MKTLETQDFNTVFVPIDYSGATSPLFNRDAFLGAKVEPLDKEGGELTHLGDIGSVETRITPDNPDVLDIVRMDVAKDLEGRGMGTALLMRALDAGRARGATAAGFRAIIDPGVIRVIEKLIEAGVIKDAAFLTADNDEALEGMSAADIVASPRRLTAAEAKAVSGIAEEGGVKVRAVAIL